MIALDSNTYIHGLWEGPHRKGGSDYLGALLRVDGQWRFTYRFRYHVDGKHFDSEDVKNWYSYHVDTEDVDEALSLIEGVMSFLGEGYDLNFIEFKCMGDDDSVPYKLALLQGTEMKVISQDEG